MKHTCINVQANLISEEVLQQIETASSSGQSAADFGLEAGSNLRNEIEYAWSRIKLDWKQFSQKTQRLPGTDTYGTSLSRRWMKLFFGSLGFELRDQRSALRGSNDQSYAVSHTADNLDDLPVHIVGFFEPKHPDKNTLDIRTSGGSSKYSPHGTMQEYLNVSDHLFGIVANGYQLRLIRDSGRLIKLTYIEFDLKRMLEEDKYSEFTLLYRILHASRFPRQKDQAEGCLLEKYYQESIESGNRIRNGLSRAVKESMLALGAGFLQHEGNASLREKIGTDALSAKDYYRQLLRIIYRLLFLMVTEERDLVYDPESKEETPLQFKKIYWEYYSVARLRKRSEKPYLYEAQYDDVWYGLVNTFRLFEPEGNGQQLAISPLGGDLFSSSAIADLAAAAISNKLMLECIRNLNEFTDSGKNLVSINYRSLDVEELGSVYEGLLELHPVIENIGSPHPSQVTFTFHEGTDRKTTGSYYTRQDLVAELIKSTLIPLIEQRLKAHAGNSADQIRSLLALKVCDAAAGSGHMLLSASRTIAWYLARLYAEDENPSRTLYQKSLREVIQHCIYGVDMNPDAVELCKLALWIEGHNSGKPLSFLDHRIRNGNSMVGVRGLDVLHDGIPDGAYDAVTGDDKEACKLVKKTNAAFNKTRQYNLFEKDAITNDTAAFSDVYQALEDIGQDDIDAVKLVREKFEQLRGNAKWWKDWRACNVWTAAFFFPYQSEELGAAPTSERLQQFLRSNEPVHEPMVKRADELSREHKFFHWPLEFPDVFEAGGFDLMLGNPPWEKIQVEEIAFFSTRHPEISALTGSNRKKRIQALEREDPTLFADFLRHRREMEVVDKFIKMSSLYPLTGLGKMNTYAIFSELVTRLINKRGRVGIVVPLGIVTDDNNKLFFSHLIDQKRLISVAGFENEEFIFPDVHHAFKFVLLALSGGDEANGRVHFTFFCRKPGDIADQTKHYELQQDDIVRLNPNTMTSPIFRTSIDAEINIKLYNRFPIIVNEHTGENPWDLLINRMINPTDDSSKFVDRGELLARGFTANGFVLEQGRERFFPLYEAKMIFQFDHRFGTYTGQTQAQANQGKLPELNEAQHQDADLIIEYAKYISSEVLDNFVSGKTERNWLFAFRDITSSVVNTTAIACIIPKTGAVDPCRVIYFNASVSAPQAACFLGMFNSKVFDYLCRQKVSGNHLAIFILKQIPVVRITDIPKATADRITTIVLELVYTSRDICAFGDDVWNEADGELRLAIKNQWLEMADYTGIDDRFEAPDGDHPLPPFQWADDRRALLRAELDAIFATLYGLDIKELRYLLDPQEVYGAEFPGETFRVLKEKEIKLYGEYRSRRLILAAWNKLHNIKETVSLTDPTSISMIDLSLHQGIYSISETAVITGFSYQKVTSWFKELYKEQYEGLDTKQARDVASGRISFHGLIELVVIGTLREAGLKMKKILQARADLNTKTNKLYPFATNNVKERLNVSGRDIIWDFGDMKVTLDGSSQANIDFITDFFRDIVFSNDVAQRLMPARGNNKVIIDPRVGLGKPVIIEKEVPVDIVAASYIRNPQAVDRIKTEFGLSEEEIMAAVAYMQ